MKTFREYLLSEAELKYTFLEKDRQRLDSFRNANESSALKLLKDKLKRSKNAEDYRKTLTHLEMDEKKLREILKHEEDRDLVVAAYILANKNPEKLDELGVDSKTFLENHKKTVEEDIVRPLLKKEGKEEESDKEQEEEPKKSENKETQKQQEPEKETESEPEPEKGAEPEKEEKKSETSYTKRSGDFEENSPKQLSNKIENIRKDLLDELENAKEKAGPEYKDEERIFDSAKRDINRIINKEKANIEKQINKFETYPTPISRNRAMSKAKIAYDKAKTESEIMLNKAKRKLLPGAIQRGAKRVKETGEKIARVGKNIASSRAGQAVGAAVKRGGKIAADAAKRGAAAAKAATERGIKNVQDRMAGQKIAQVLGTDSSEKFYDLLKNNKRDEAYKIHQEAIAKSKKEGQEEKYDKMKKAAETKVLKQAAQKGSPTKASKSLTDRFRAGTQALKNVKDKMKRSTG